MTVPKSLLGFGGLGAGLVALLASELMAAAPVRAVRAPAANVSIPRAAIAAPVVATAAPVLVDAILARPLFQVTRRPPPAVAAAVASGPIGLPRLTGVMASNLGKRLIFAPGPDGKPVTVTEGGHIGPYLVQSIGVGEAVVIGPDGAKTLRPAFNAADQAGAGSPMLAGGADRNAMIELMRAGGALPGMGVSGAQQAIGMGALAAPGSRLRNLPPRSSLATSPGLQP